MRTKTKLTPGQRKNRQRYQQLLEYVIIFQQNRYFKRTIPDPELEEIDKKVSELRNLLDQVKWV
jgi:uncharacterized protein YeeX (DUF496 family)